MQNLTPSPELAIIAAMIRDRVNRTAYQIGQDLIKARALCRHGEWQPFLQAAGTKPSTARELMQYVRLVGPDPDLKALPPVRAMLDQHRAAPNMKTTDSVVLKPEPDPPDRQLEIARSLFSNDQPPRVRRAARMLMSAWLDEQTRRKVP